MGLQAGVGYVQVRGRLGSMGTQSWAEEGPLEPEDADLCREQNMRTAAARKNYQPEHGKGWRDAEWQTVIVYTRAQGFGSDAWLEEPARQSKKPGEAPDAMRKRLLEAREKACDVRLEALDF